MSGGRECLPRQAPGPFTLEQLLWLQFRPKPSKLKAGPRRTCSLQGP